MTPPDVLTREQWWTSLNLVTQPAPDGPDDAVRQAADLGHRVVSSPPTAMSTLRGWACVTCGLTVFDNDHKYVYGTASVQRCPHNSEEMPAA